MAVVSVLAVQLTPSCDLAGLSHAQLTHAVKTVFLKQNQNVNPSETSGTPTKNIKNSSETLANSVGDK